MVDTNDYYHSAMSTPLVTIKWLLCIRKSASLSSFALFCSKWPSFPTSYKPKRVHSFRTPEYEGKEGHLEQKRAKEDSDAIFLIQRSHFMVTSVSSIKIIRSTVSAVLRATLQEIARVGSRQTYCRMPEGWGLH